ncbi:enoyl-CoA hydratase/isomerase family protein [Ralstonia pseudosolanacearum]|uniref:enoyl-CoA hydratase/isomerase family protein n=1 Tax=Ralstonia pseudosolanacearum TaxID=1310165 RepID=UPI003AAEAAC1
MSQNAIRLETDAVTGIATITLTIDRSGGTKALDDTLCARLCDALGQVELDDRTRVVVLQGAGPHFMPGSDIKIFHTILGEASAVRRQRFERLIADAHESILRIRRMEKPVIASVRGVVAGFGLSLMNSCDLAVAADGTFFTMAYCNIGTSPDGSVTYGLPRVVGLKRAMEIALLGERFDARQALEFGLVNRVVPASALVDTTRSMAMRLAASPTRALGRTKRLLNESFNRTLAEQLQAEQESFSQCAAEADFEREVRAVVEKRKPLFSGR